MSPKARVARWLRRVADHLDNEWDTTEAEIDRMFVDGQPVQCVPTLNCASTFSYYANLAPTFGDGSR